MDQFDSEMGISDVVIACGGFIRAAESVVFQETPSEVDVAAVHAAYIFLNDPNLRDMDFLTTLEIGERIALAKAFSDLAWAAGNKPKLFKSKEFGCEDPIGYARENLRLVRYISEDTKDTLMFVKTANNIAVLEIRQATGRASAGSGEEEKASLEKIQGAVALLREVVDNYGLELALATETSVDLLIKLVEAHNNLAQAALVTYELGGEEDKQLLQEAITGAFSVRGLIERHVLNTSDRDLIGAYILITNSLAHLKILNGECEEAEVLLKDSKRLQNDYVIERFKNETPLLVALSTIIRTKREADEDIAKRLWNSTRAEFIETMRGVKISDDDIEDLWLLKRVKGGYDKQVTRLGISFV